MNKREFTEIISRFEPDEGMKERIERKILTMKRTEKKSKKSARKTVIISVCAAAAVLAVSMPVMAEHIPAVRSVIEFFMGNFSKEPIEHNNAVPEFVESVNVSAEDAENGVLFNVQNVYFDGEDIVIYFLMEAQDHAFSEYMSLSSEDFELYANGKKITWNEEEFSESVRIISGANCGNNSFAGMINFKGDVLPDCDNFDMEIKINSLMGSRNVMAFNYDAENPVYEWQKPDNIPADISCEFNVAMKKGLVKKYRIGEGEAGYILNSATVTPLKTAIDLTMPSEADVMWTLTDNNGNELEYIGGGEFDSPLKNAESLTLTLKDMYADGFPEICSFTFNIDGGYRSSIPNPVYDPTEPEYIPSPKEAEKWVEENRIRLTAYDVSVNPSGSCVETEDGKFSVTVSDYTLIKNVNDLDLSGNIVSPYDVNSRRIDDDGNISDMTLVVFDYTIKNNSGEELLFCAGNEKLCPADDITVTLNGGDPAYLSPKDNGGKNGYMLNFAPNEERTVKIGFLINDEYDDSELIFGIGENYLSFKN